MKKLRLLAAAASIALLLPAAANAREFSRPSLVEVIRGSGYTIPPEWAGVWQDDDSTYSCTPRVFQEFTSDIDTLCAGTSFEPDTSGGFSYDCTGTVTSTSVDLTCTGTFKFEGCTATFTVRTLGTRTGNTAVVNTRITTVFTPPFCAFLPDSCEDRVTYSTRIAPEPPTCLTSTRSSTWGALKTQYR